MGDPDTKKPYYHTNPSFTVRLLNAGRNTVDTFKSVQEWRYTAEDGVYEFGQEYICFVTPELSACCKCDGLQCFGERL